MTPFPTPQEKPHKTYVCHYYHDGSKWGLNITAADWEDAEARVKKLGNLHLDGELKATYPISLGWWCKLSVAIRNFLWK